MRYVSLFFALTITSCATKPKSFSDQYCDDVLEWADSGPRDYSIDATRKVYFPNSNTCYRAGGDDTVVVTCLTVDWVCADNEACSDKADKAFRSAAFRYAHSWTEFSYFQNTAKCVGARETIAPVNSDEADLSQAYSIFRQGDRIDLQYDPDERLTKIEITYDAER